MSGSASRVVSLVTGSRAEWGLLRTVARAVDAHPGLSLRLVAAGSHLVAGTDVDIDLPLAARVPMQEKGHLGRAADAAAVGRGVVGFAQLFERQKPDFVAVLGDRIEAFAAASAASVMGLRVAHLHGGDRAEGVADEAMRHAITKLAHLHLVATEASAARVRGLGEAAETIVQVGSPAIDGIDRVAPATDGPAVVVLQHPVGESDAQERRRMALTLAATAEAGAAGERLVLHPNLDPGREGVLAALAAHANPAEVATHLPRDRFLALLKGARLLVGNSSAGLIEAAACRCPAVDIGPRQGGRERPGHVQHAEHDLAAIRAAMRRARGFDFEGFEHPYGDGHAGERVARCLAEVGWDVVPIRKRNSF